jgi:hypothetical protein
MLALGAGGGCSRTSAGPEKTKKSSSVATKRKRPTVESLPKLEKTLDPVDDGRLVVTAPKGWHVPSNTGEYLVRISKSRVATLPIILVSGEDFKHLDTVTRDDMEDFVDVRRDALKEAKTKLAEEVEPLVLKSFRGVEYRKRSRNRKTGELRETLFLETVVQKRLYRIELHTQLGTMDEYRSYAYAVAAGLKFPKVKLDDDEPAAGEEVADE